MNFPQQSGYEKYFKGFLKTPPAPKAPLNPALIAAGMGGAASGAAANQFSYGDMMKTITGEADKPQPFDLQGRLAQLGGPPQRPPLPVRPGPDRSAGSIIGQVLAGASDVVGAGAGLRTANLDKMQALQRQQRDLRYGDDLTRAAADFDNQQRGWNFQLQKIGMEQGADREKFGRGMEEKRFGLAEGGQKFGQDMATKGFERQGSWRTEDLLRDKERFTEDKRRYDEGALARDTDLNTRVAREAREAETHGLTVPLLKKQVEDITSPKGLGPDLAGQLLTGGEKNASISQMKDNANAEKSRLMQAVLLEQMPRSKAEARIKEIDEALQRQIGGHIPDQSDAMKMTTYNTMRFLFGDDIAGSLVDRPEDGIPGALQKGFEQSWLGKIRANPNPFMPLRSAMPD